MDTEEDRTTVVGLVVLADRERRMTMVGGES